MSKKRSERNTKAFKKVAPQTTRGSLITDICNLAILATREIENGNGYTEDSPDALLSFVVKSYLDSGQEHIIISSMEKLMDSGQVQPAMLLDSIADALSDSISSVDINESNIYADVEEVAIDTHLFIIPMMLHYESNPTVGRTAAINSTELRKCLTDSLLLDAADFVNDGIEVAVSPFLYTVENLPVSFTDRRKFIAHISEYQAQQEQEPTPSSTQANVLLRFMAFTVKGDADYLDGCAIVNPELLLSTDDETDSPYAESLANFSAGFSKLIQQRNPQIFVASASFPDRLRDGISTGVTLWNGMSLHLVLAKFDETGEKPDKAYFDFVEISDIAEIHIAIHSKGKRVDAKWIIMDGDFESAAESIMNILSAKGITDIYMPAEEPASIANSPRGIRLH